MEFMLLAYNLSGVFKVINPSSGELSEYAAPSLSSRLFCLSGPSCQHFDNIFVVATSTSMILFSSINFKQRWELKLSFLTNKSYPGTVNAIFLAWSFLKL